DAAAVLWAIEELRAAGVVPSEVGTKRGHSSFPLIGSEKDECPLLLPFTAPSAAGQGDSTLPGHGRPAGASTCLGRRGRPPHVAGSPVSPCRVERALRGAKTQAALTPGSPCEPPRLPEAPRKPPTRAIPDGPARRTKKLAACRRSGIPALAPPRASACRLRKPARRAGYLKR